MSEQGRKQEDISTHKSSRTATTTLAPQLGAASSSPLLAYSLPPPPHEYSSHHRLFTMMRPGALAIPPQMAQSAKPCDMGPPIFMPSLNLGNPKSSSSSSASSPVPSSSGPNSSVSGPTLSVGGTSHAHTMSDIILSNAPSVPEFHHSIHPFYSGPGIRPGSGHIAIPTGPPQVSAVITNKRPSVSTSSIAKPTPVQASLPTKNTAMPYIKTLSPVLPPTTKGLVLGAVSLPGGLINKSSSSAAILTSCGGFSTSVSSSVQSQSFAPGTSVIKQPLSSQPRQLQFHHSQHGSSPSSTPSYPPLSAKQQPHQRTNPEPVYITHPAMQGHMIPVAAYPAMLPAPSATVIPGGHPTISTLTELLAPGAAVTSSALREGGGGGKLGGVGMRPYSPGQQHVPSTVRHGPSALRERSASGDTASSGAPSPQTAPDTHPHNITSAQPTLNDHTDTRLERPAQPSSGSSTMQQQLPSPQGVPSPYQGPHRERSNSTEVSNIIISMPGLTGRHIAAISSNQPPGYPTPNSQPLPSQTTSDPFRGARSKSEYPGVDSTPLPQPHPTTLHLVAGSSQLPAATPGGGVGGKLAMQTAPSFGQLPGAQSTLTATIISSTSSPVNPSGAAPHPNSLPLSVPGSPLANLSPSRRPGIIRKRPHESGWTGSPNMNKVPFGTSLPLLSPGHTPRSDNGAHPSHPLSPPISTHTPLTDTLTNHISTGQTDSAAPPISDVLPSPRKKRRKQDVIATDDQYATNVPNNIRPDVAMAMDSEHATALSPHNQTSSVTMVTRERGRADNSSSPREESVGPQAQALPPEGGGEKVAEVQYLSQLRQPQWPINGLYRMHHRAAHNHFKRHADIKHIEIETVTASAVANDKTAVSRASGWKIHRLDPQVEEMLQVERDILETMQKVERSLSNLSQCATCTVSSEVLDGLGEIVQGNVARSNCIILHLETTRNKMVKLLDHKPTVLDILMKYSTNKRSSPTGSLPPKLRT